MNRTFFPTAVLILVVTFYVEASADNWAHWRGPTGNSVAPDAKPPIEWSETKNVKWKVPIPGRGSGSPVIWENKVFVTTAVEAETREDAKLEGRTQNERPQDRRRGGGGNSAALKTLDFKLLCFNRGTGDLIWEKTAVTAKPHQATHSTNGFASASPCTDGEHVYAHFGSRGLYCYTMDGDLKWKRDDFGKMETRNDFGEGSSPTIVDNMIIVPWDHEGQSALYALNKATGDTIWKTDRDEPSCWATPLIVEHKSGKQVIMNGQNKARAYDLESGKEIWQCGGQTERPVASPVAADGIVYIGSGFRGSFLGAFRLNAKGNIEGSDHVLWSIDKDTPDIGSPLLTNGRIYFHKGKSGMLSCYDSATGKPHYTATRIDGLDNIYASPVAANGHVYLTDRSGTTVVIEDSDKLKIVATNSVGETVDATPAPVDNQLFIRGEKHLYCIAE